MTRNQSKDFDSADFAAEEQKLEAQLKELRKSRADTTLEQQTADDLANRQDKVFDQHTVVVTRDPMTKVSTQVLDHEIPILEAIHGVENVQIVATERVNVTDIDAGTEFDRLVRKYERSTEGGDIVFQVYGRNPRQLAEEIGLPYKMPRGAGARQAREVGGSLVIDNANPGPEIAETKVSRITSEVKAKSTETPGRSPASRAVEAENLALAKVAAREKSGAKPAAKTKAAAKPAAKKATKAKK